MSSAPTGAGTPDPGSRDILRFGPFEFGCATNRLVRDGVEVHLTPKAAAVLGYLLERRGELIPKEEFLAAVWQDVHVREESLTQAISVIRHALGDTCQSPEFIETVTGSGYRFIGEIWSNVQSGDSFNETGDARFDPSPSARRGLTRSHIALGVTSAALAAFAFAWLSGPNDSALARHRRLTFSGTAYSPAVSADGENLAYVERIAGQPDRLFVGPADGQEASEIFAARSIGTVRWSPGGHTLALVGSNDAGEPGVFLVPHFGRAPRFFPLAGYNQALAWNPSRSHFATLAADGRAIKVTDASSGATVTLGSNVQRREIVNLDWSPDGERFVLLYHAVGGDSELWIADREGLSQRLIARSNQGLYSPRWSPAGDSIYWLRNEGETSDLCKVDVLSDGSSGTPLTILTGLEAGTSFTVSRDGFSLFYTRETSEAHLTRLRADAESPARFDRMSLTSGTGVDVAPAVSADGRSVAFQRRMGTVSEVFVMPLSGGDPKRLTSLGGRAAIPKWSPDGTRIAFVALHEGVLRVWTVPAEGGLPRVFPNSSPVSYAYLSWSPGPRILYRTEGNFRFLDPDSGDEEWLLEPAEALQAPAIGPVAVSADGERLVVSRSSASGPGLFIHGRKERSWRQLVSGLHYPIRFSEDGDAIIVQRGLALMRVELKDAASTHIMDLPASTGYVAMEPGGRGFVISTYQDRSDVWRIENFDGYRY